MDSDFKENLKQVAKVAIIFIIAVAAYAWWTRPAPMGGDFKLVNSNEQTVTQADLRAKPSAVFFGYTHCPDICPTTVFDLASWLKRLGPKADKINAWFITVDPQRDTPQILHEYLGNVSDKIIGISGDPKIIDKVVKSFGVAAEKREDADGEYTFDHTASIILLRKGGRKLGMIPYQQKDSLAIKQLNDLADSAD